MKLLYNKKGAGPNWHGRHGVHTHITNTRITDVEILENRYPILLNKFQLRKSTGGKGKFNGGDGLIREMIFRDHLKLCILSERRVFQPYGLFGGEPGARGRNTFVKKNGCSINLGSKSEIDAEPGDMFRLETPGGGGFGEITCDSQLPQHNEQVTSGLTHQKGGSLHHYQSIQESV